MTIANLPNFIGIDEVRVYKNNEYITGEYIDAGTIFTFNECVALKPYLDNEINYLEMETNGYFNDEKLLIIYLK